MTVRLQGKLGIHQGSGKWQKIQEKLAKGVSHGKIICQFQYFNATLDDDRITQ